jgi:hypothetical protein
MSERELVQRLAWGGLYECAAAVEKTRSSEIGECRGSTFDEDGSRYTLVVDKAAFQIRWHGLVGPDDGRVVWSSTMEVLSGLVERRTGRKIARSEAIFDRHWLTGLKGELSAEPAI